MQKNRILLVALTGILLNNTTIHSWNPTQQEVIAFTAGAATVTVASVWFCAHKLAKLEKQITEQDTTNKERYTKLNLNNVNSELNKAIKSAADLVEDKLDSAIYLLDQKVSTLREELGRDINAHRDENAASLNKTRTELSAETEIVRQGLQRKITTLTDGVNTLQKELDEVSKKYSSDSAQVFSKISHALKTYREKESALAGLQATVEKCIKEATAATSQLPNITQMHRQLIECTASNEQLNRAVDGMLKRFDNEIVNTVNAQGKQLAALEKQIPSASATTPVTAAAQAAPSPMQPLPSATAAASETTASTATVEATPSDAPATHK